MERARWEIEMKLVGLSVAVAPVLAMIACGSSSPSSPSSSSSSSPSSSVAPAALRGTYVPEGSSSLAQFSSLSFVDGTHYSYTRANCDAGTCSSQGTYTYDGEDLELTDAATLATEHVDFQPTEVSATTTTQSLHVLGGGVVTDGGALVSSAGSLIKQIIEGLVNGLLMKLIDGGSGAAVSDAGTTAGIPPQSDVDVAGAIAELQQQLASPPLATYYQDGSRAAGCWLNPVGKDLSDIQKAFYCSMPLEFRLCNSLVLLTTQDSQVDERWQEFLQCEQRVDQIAGGQGRYLYDAKVNATYYWLFLNKISGLSSADEATVADSVRPPASGQSFSMVLMTIVGSLATEAADPAFTELQPLIDQAKSAAAAVGQSIG